MPALAPGRGGPPEMRVARCKARAETVKLGALPNGWVPGIEAT